MSVRIYHNPRCSKSRQALQLLRDQGIEPTIVEYLKTPPQPAEIRDLLDKLKIAPEALLRRGEAAFREAGLDQGTPDAEAVIQAMHAFPKLIERPIVVNGERAVIGRPPERVLEVLDQ